MLIFSNNVSIVTPKEHRIREDVKKPVNRHEAISRLYNRILQTL